MGEDYQRIMQAVEDLKREHFKTPCDPTRCSHLTRIAPPGSTTEGSSS